MGEVDPLGNRGDALDAFLEQHVEAGYVIETRTDTHAIIYRRPKGLKRIRSGADPGRCVVEVDEMELRRCVRQSRDAAEAIPAPAEGAAVRTSGPGVVDKDIGEQLR